MKLPIYMDHHATTPVAPEVFEAMRPYFLERFGNAASRNHAFGWAAESAVEAARSQIALLIGCKPVELVFTSGATESDNLAIKGVAQAYREKGTHIITSQIEHHAVLDSCKRLQKDGFQVTSLPVSRDGRVDPADVAKALTPKTILVSIMLANNEIGTVQPLAEIGRLCKERGVLFHSDAVQGVGKIPVNVDALGLDLMSLTAHKLYGPKGVGALYVRMGKPRVKLVAQMDGGGHEKGRRSGTLNVPGIVGFGKACELAGQLMAGEAARLTALRERLWAGIRARLDHAHLNGHPTLRLPGNLNVSFEYVEGESLLMSLKDVAVSSGSACTSASLEPSYVLKALGIGEALAHTSIRFGLGRGNTEEEVDYVCDRLAEQVTRLRAMSPLYEMAQDGVDLNTAQWSLH
ncbi:MAG: IscS subfamily cysteine desulfurase [candidate division NC10 bacterium]|nr:IscS subfamily cysteine desulfurase [candidate division NC10 bacterium]MBI2455889.1 IscS subfamily cysteine desulfurase [candidate division NC10 bacterium]